MMSYELERIEELCRERGWSHYRLALEMDTSPNNIGNLFRRTMPKKKLCRKILLPHVFLLFVSNSSA